MTTGIKLARSLAKMPAVSWEKIAQQLWVDCPSPQSWVRGLTFTRKQQEAVMALGVFYLESGFLHEDKILDYLLLVETLLSTASFTDNKSRLSSAEMFSFDLTSLLNDIASHHNHNTAERIVTTQISLMTNILRQLQQEPAGYSGLVSVLLGLCRAMARFSTPSEHFLRSKIFTPDSALSRNKSETTNLLAFNTNFRYIIS